MKSKCNPKNYEVFCDFSLDKGMEIYVIRDVKDEIRQTKYYNFLSTIQKEKNSQVFKYLLFIGIIISLLVQFPWIQCI